MSKIKNPFLSDWVLGIYGTFKPDTITPVHGDKKNLVRFEYVPLNKVFPRKYPIAIPRENIIRVSNTNSQYAGTEPEICFIIGDEEGKAEFIEPVLGTNGRFHKSLLKLQKEIEDLKFDKAMLQNKISELQSDTKKQIAIDKELRSSPEKKEKDVQFPFGSKFSQQQNDNPDEPHFWGEKWNIAINKLKLKTQGLLSKK